MRQRPFDSILAIIAALSGSVWFGMSLAHQTVAYDLFVAGSSTLRNVGADVQLNIMRLAANLSVFATISYMLLILSFSLYCIRQRNRFKIDGYLMMCLVLCLVAVPPGLYATLLMVHFYGLFPNHSSIEGLNLEQISPTFILLYTKQYWLNFASLAGYATIVVLLIAKPLRLEAVETTVSENQS